MSHTAILGEILYQLSTYELHRAEQPGHWHAPEREDLIHSVQMMLYILHLMDTPGTPSDDAWLPIETYIHQHTGSIFPTQALSFGPMIRQVSATSDPRLCKQECAQVRHMMGVILEDIRLLLNNQELDYQQKVAYLFNAFHHLPRVYLGSHRILGTTVEPLTCDEAKAYVHSYLEIQSELVDLPVAHRIHSTPPSQ